MAEDNKPKRPGAGPARARGASRRPRGRQVLLVRWGALAALLLAFATWGWLVVDGAGRMAAAVLAEDPGDAPVDVFAAPRVLARGRAAHPEDVARELRAAGYAAVDRDPQGPGEYRLRGDRLEVYRRSHVGPAGEVRAARANLVFDGVRVVSLERADGRALEAFALEPVRLGAFRGPVLAERRPLALQKFPRRLVEAVLSAEDARFLSHGGVDPLGIARAIWRDLFGRGPLQGGSTITQQVVKNRIVGAERSIARKAHEAVLASYVEGRVSKERLLEIYLNEIYLGQRGSVSVVGMPAAASFYFGRNVDDLELHQMALLAGIISSPGRFDPRRHPQAARERMRWVLRRMQDQGYIDQAEAQAAAGADFGLAPVEEPLDPAGDVLDAVRRELEAKGYEPRPGKQRAQVYTTLDLEIQVAARRALDLTLAELEKDEPGRAPLEGAVVVLRPGSGEVLALVGGRAGTRGNFHRALDAARQPGSAFKPFVTLAGFAEGRYLPSSVVEDAPLTVGTARGPWSPVNYDRAFRGDVTVRRAIEESLNVPVVRMGLALGPKTIVEWARKAGLDGHLPAQPALALGAGEVRPLDLAGAYATIAALGVRHEPLLVRTVRSGPGGQPVALATVPPAERALPATACWMVLDAMSGVVERGTGRNLAEVLGGRRVAAKTGTTQDGRDAWFVLVSGNAVVVVYVGRDDNKPAQLTGAGSALPVARRLVAITGTRLLAPLPGAPGDVRIVEVDPTTGGRATPRCPTRVNEVFTAGQEPEPCREHGSALRRLWDRLTGKGK